MRMENNYRTWLIKGLRQPSRFLFPNADWYAYTLATCIFPRSGSIKVRLNWRLVYFIMSTVSFRFSSFYPRPGMEITPTGNFLQNWYSIFTCVLVLKMTSRLESYRLCVKLILKLLAGRSHLSTALSISTTMEQYLDLSFPIQMYEIIASKHITSHNSITGISRNRLFLYKIFVLTLDKNKEKLNFFWNIGN